MRAICAFAITFGAVDAHRVHHKNQNELKVDNNGTQAGSDEVKVKDEGDPFWQFVCQGYVKGEHQGRQDFGKTRIAKSVETCKSTCRAHTLCNAVTYDFQKKICFMDAFPVKPGSETCPSDSTNALSFWFGPAVGDAKPLKVEPWGKACDGYLQSQVPGKKRFSREKNINSSESCMNVCDAHYQCNSVTYDGRYCSILYIPMKPNGSMCKGNKKKAAAWWRDEAAAPAMQQHKPEPDVLHDENAIVKAEPAKVLKGTRVPECGDTRLKFGEKGCFFKCESDLDLDMTAPAQKGLALDDTTLHWCPENAHFMWPNTNQPVTSFRMFKAWAPWWTESWLNKTVAWEGLAKHLRANNGKVLVGTQISCNETEDDMDWENVKEMMKLFGPKHIMGVAIGNELELLWTKAKLIANLSECLDRMWTQEYFLNKFHDRVRELDAMGAGFAEIKVTSVFGGFILADPGLPFFDRKDRARVGPWVTNVTQTYGERYVHTVNIYPYFENDYVEYDNTSKLVEPKTCNKALEKCTCFEAEDPNACIFTWLVVRMRERLHMLGNASSQLWIGETGWSYPQATTLGTKMKWCPEWSSAPSKVKFYQNFLKWDLGMQGKYKGPDHIFYFAMRDSANFGKQEGFGLIGDGDAKNWCTNTTCKLQQSSLGLA